jgi:hypothetical protein
MKNPEPTLLTHEIVCTFPGFTGLTRKGSRPPGLVAASSDELYGPFSEAATRASPFKIQGFGIWGGRRRSGWQDPGRKQGVSSISFEGQAKDGQAGA